MKLRVMKLRTVTSLLPVMLGIMSAGSAEAQIFVVDSRIPTVGEYNNAGSTVNANLINGLTNPAGIAVSGSDLYVTDFGTTTTQGFVGKYTTSGDVVNTSLITGLKGPFGIAVSGSDLFVANSLTGIIGHYTTSGTVVNSSLISGLTSPTP
jgi:hypothetical protein